MSILFKKKKKKELNIASTPEHSITSPKPSTIKVIFFVWNILSIILYSSYTFFVVYRTTEKTFLSEAIKYLLAIYVIVFVVLFVLSFKNKKKLKYNLKNYKSATTLLKYTVNFINFSLSIITAISAFVVTGNADIHTIVYAVLALFITIVSVFIEIIKIIIRKNIPLIKYNFLEMRDKVDDSKKPNQKNSV